MSLCTASTQKIIWHIRSNRINYRRINILVHTRTYDNTTAFISFPEFPFLSPIHSSPLKVSSSSSALPPPCINILFSLWGLSMDLMINVDLSEPHGRPCRFILHVMTKKPAPGHGLLGGDLIMKNTWHSLKYKNANKTKK